MTFDTLRAGGSTVATVVARLNDGVQHGKILESRATARSEERPDPDSTDNSAVARVRAVRSGAGTDLALEQTASPNPVPLDSALTYTIVVRNQGADAAVSVVVEDQLPLEVDFVACQGTGDGACGGSGNARSVSFPVLDPGAAETVTLVAHVKASVAPGSLISNTASVRSTTEDPDSANDSSASVVTATRIAPRYDIVVVVTDDQAPHTLQFMPRTNALIGDVGVRFTNGLATTPLCCPSRASFLTGRYSHNHGVLTNNLPGGGATKFGDASTLATWLQAAGYLTGLYGKYLNQYEELTPWPYIPPGWSDWHALARSHGYHNYDMVDEMRHGK